MFDKFREQLSARGIDTSAAFTAALMHEAGVALLPGSAFGMPPESLTARLAFVDFDGEQIDTAPGEPEFARVREGIDAICDWLKKLG